MEASTTVPGHSARAVPAEGRARRGPHPGRPRRRRAHCKGAPNGTPRAQRQVMALRTVLLVIEDRALSDVLSDALVGAGHIVTQADDVPASRAALVGQSFDAAIVDLDTRARDGVQLIARVRIEHPATTVIAL